MMQKIEWPGNLVIESGVEHPFVAPSILKGAVTTYPYLIGYKVIYLTTYLFDKQHFSTVLRHA
jgi:hypothetical protein